MPFFFREGTYRPHQGLSSLDKFVSPFLLMQIYFQYFI